MSMKLNVIIFALLCSLLINHCSEGRSLQKRGVCRSLSIKQSILGSLELNINYLAQYKNCLPRYSKVYEFINYRPSKIDSDGSTALVTLLRRAGSELKDVPTNCTAIKDENISDKNGYIFAKVYSQAESLKNSLLEIIGRDTAIWSRERLCHIKDNNKTNFELICKLLSTQDPELYNRLRCPKN